MDTTDLIWVIIGAVWMLAIVAWVFLGRMWIQVYRGERNI